MTESTNNSALSKTQSRSAKIKTYIFFHLPWQLLALLIFILSSISNDDLPALAFHVSDKLSHFVVFGIFSILLYRSLIRAESNLIRLNAFKFSVLFSSLYGALDEIHQLFVPGRFASVGDWIADSLGIILLFLYIKIFPDNSKVQNTGN